MQGFDGGHRMPVASESGGEKITVRAARVYRGFTERSAIREDRRFVSG